MLAGPAVSGAVDAEKEALLRSLVRETIALFGAARCMFASNFHINGAVSDSDGASEVGPSMAELYAKFEAWVEDLSDEEKRRLFAGSAAEFYRV